MKKHYYLLLLVAFISSGCYNNNQEQYKDELLNATAALRAAFTRGDIDAIVAMHHPDIEKYFGGSNVVKGREQLKKGLTEMYQQSRMEFIGHKLESLVFNGNTAVETSIFTIKSTR